MTTDVSKKAQDVLARARTHLVTSHPVFASIVLRYPFTWTRDVPTAGITPRGNIMLNPDFIEPLRTQQVVFLLAHEAMHFMGMHAIRRKHRKPRKWNWANDAVINDMLIHAGVGEFIDGGVQLSGSRSKNSETVYNEMDDDAEVQDFSLDGDILDGDALMTQSEITSLETEIKLVVAQAMSAAKIKGAAIPGDLKRLFEDIIDVRTPWYTILERHFSHFKPEGTTWNRPSRRHVSSDLYLPGMNRISTLKEVVLAIDTSGSISADEIAHFKGHIQRIIDDCHPEKIHVVCCDCKITSACTFEDSEDLTIDVKGGGGTAFHPVFTWVEENAFNPDLLVYLTDLCGNTNFTPPEYPVFWLSTSRQQASFGEVIKYEISN